jgi:hypothetical protein
MVEGCKLLVELWVPAFERFGVLEEHFRDDGEEFGRARRSVFVDIALAMLFDVIYEARKLLAQHACRRAPGTV